MAEKFLNNESSKESKRAASDAIFDAFSELLFERLNLINASGAVSTSTTDTSTFTTLMRVSDTTGGKFMGPDRNLRFRGSFYVSGTVEKADFYILTPLVTTAGVVTGLTNLQVSDGFVGLHCNAGSMTLESWDGTKLRSKDAGTLVGDTTYYIEIIYNKTYAEVYIDGRSLGSISCNLTNTLDTYTAMHVLFCPIRSKDGTSVNLNVESYQILQEK